MPRRQAVNTRHGDIPVTFCLDPLERQGALHRRQQEPRPVMQTIILCNNRKSAPDFPARIFSCNDIKKLH